MFVTQTLNRGGAERVVSLLSQEFVRIGYEVKIILFDDKVQYEYGGAIININTPPSVSYLTKIIRLFQRVSRLKKIFKKEKPNYIFSFMESCNFSSILTGEKVLVSMRNNPNKKHNFHQKILIRVLYKFKNVIKVVAVSKEIKSILNKDYNLKNTISILNPVVFHKNYVLKENLSKYQPYLVSIGRLNKQKNFEFLINTYAKTKTKDKAKLLIVGEGQERIKLEKIIHNLRLSSNIFLLGQKENIKDYYLQSDLYILSSSFEGFPNVLIEALSNSCASIATNCPTGPSEIISNNQNGMLVENENQEEMIKAIDKLYFNQELKGNFRKNAKKSIEHLKLETIAKEWLDID